MKNSVLEVVLEENEVLGASRIDEGNQVAMLLWGETELSAAGLWVEDEGERRERAGVIWVCGYCFEEVGWGWPRCKSCGYPQRGFRSVNVTEGRG